MREGKTQAISVYNAKVDELERIVERELIQLRREETFVSEWQFAIEHPFNKRDDD